MRRLALAFAGLSVALLIGCGQTPLGNADGSVTALGVTPDQAGTKWTEYPYGGPDNYSFENPCLPGVTVSVKLTVEGVQSVMFLPDGGAQIKQRHTWTGTGEDTAGNTYAASGSFRDEWRDNNTTFPPNVRTWVGHITFEPTNGGPTIREQWIFHINRDQDDVTFNHHATDEFFCVGGPGRTAL